MLNPQQIKDINLLVKQVGEFQLENQAQVRNTEIDEKSLNQLVSYVDVESEKMLVSSLKTITPAAGYLTEESTDTTQNKELYWIIDPVDGTTNYIFGLNKYAISIALYANDKPVYGCVYVAADDELFHADPSGAYLNGTLISVAVRSNMQDTLIATGFPYYNFAEMDEYINVLTQLMRDTRGLRRMGSAAIDLAYTAAGRFDAFFELNLSPWDVAAGAYIVQQAGGLVTDFKGGDDYVFGTSILASSKPIYAPMKKLIDQNNF